jgi:hypothetical protein
MLDLNRAFFFLLLTALSLSAYSTDFVYLAVFAYLIVFFGSKLFSFSLPLCVRLAIQVSKKSNRIELTAASFLRNSWWLILVSWVYGIFLSMLLGVPSEHAFRNFFGMVVYIVSPILICTRMSVPKLVSLVTIAGVIQILVLAYFVPRSIDALTSLDFSSLSELRVTYNLGSLVILPLLMVSTASIFYSNLIPNQQTPIPILKWVDSKIGLVILLFLVIVPSMSKGLFLIAVLFFTIPLFLTSIKKLLKGFFPVGLIVFFSIFLIIYFLLPQAVLDAIYFTFSDVELSNSYRNEQFQYLVNEFSLSGSGLGSALKSGYARDDVSFYGFELNYLNIVHKLGIASLPLFLAYVVTVLLSLYRIVRGYRLFESYFALGLMGYLVQGAANPILLAPVTVLLHCFAIHMLIYPAEKN